MLFLLLYSPYFASNEVDIFPDQKTKLYVRRKMFGYTDSIVHKSYLVYSFVYEPPKYVRFVNFNNKSVFKSAYHWRFGIYNQSEYYYILHLKRLYVSPIREITDGNTYFLHPNYFEGNCLPRVANVVLSCNSCVCGFDGLCTFYGDMFKFFPLFLLYPREIINNAVIPLYKKFYYRSIADLFALLNISAALVKLNRDEFVYSENVYITFNRLHNNLHFNALTRNFSAILRRAFKLDEIEPHQYVLLNRRIFKCRYIINFGSFVRKVVKKFKDINWTIFPGTFPSISETAKNFGLVRFICMMAGSNTMNLIYSKSEIGQVVIISTPIDILFLLAETMRIWTEVVILTGFRHYSHKPIFIRYQSIEPSIRYVLYAIANKKWPNTDCDSYFPLEGNLIGI